jgi:putative ABC transport system permease protein
VLRTAIDPLAVVATVRRELLQIDAGVVMEKVKTMEHLRDESISAQRFAMTLISAFSVVALALAVIGIFGVMSHTVVQRSHEIGIRMAIGAQQHHVLHLILRQGMLLASIGIVLGLAGALAVTGVLRSLLFEINPTDPLTFVAISGLLVIVTGLACWLPARRATKIDPLAVLRSE